MMIYATQIRKGMILIHNGQPFKVMEFRFTVQGRGANLIPVKMKNILTGTQAEIRYRSDDKVEETEIDLKPMQYVYQDGAGYWFMDNTTFEQVPVQADVIEDVKGFLLPDSLCKVEFYGERPIGVILPVTVQLKVADTEPAIRDATASGRVTKTAELETGLSIQVPMFVEKGDTVIVNTSSGEYQGRPGRQ
jgi:elongation factor P